MEPTASRPLTGSAASQPTDLGECSICLESLDDRAEFNSRTVMSLTPCRHLYHRECLDRNMTYNLNCPNCRSGINPKNIVVLYPDISLHEAVENELLPVVKRLINKLPVDALNEQGETALMVAARKGNLQIIKTLIDNGANPAICTRDNVTAFDMAQNDNIRSHLAKALIERSIATGTPCDNAGHDITHYLTEINCPELRDVLQNTDIDLDTLTASLHVAFQKGKTHVAEVLIDWGANINIPSDQEGLTWLYHASKAKNWIVAEKLMAAGANFPMPVSINEEVAVFDPAVKHFEPSVIKSLIQRGIIKFDQLTQDNLFTLCLWAAKNSLEIFIFDFLTENDFDFNLKNKNRETALHVLARTSLYGSAFKKLIKWGVDVNATNSEGETALHLSAAKLTSYGVLIALIEAGADVNALAHDGSTPLHRAAQKGSLLNASILINKGTLQTTLNRDKKTALQLAAENNETTMVYTLLGLGGDYATCTENGDMLFDLFPPDRLLSEFIKGGVQPFIFNRDFNPDRPCSRDGSTLLSYAIRYEDTVVINKLLEYGASTDNLTPEQKETLSRLRNCPLNPASLIHRNRDQSEVRAASVFELLLPDAVSRHLRM